MSRCDFSSIISIIRKYIKESSRISQPDLICELFYSFSDDNEDFDFDNAQINRWIKGAAPVSPKISEYYQHSAAAEKLRFDIESCIFPLLYDPDMAVQEIYNLIINDISISENKRSRLTEKFASDNIAFIADVIIFTLSRTFEKNELALKTGKFSPVVEERIIDGDVPKPCKFFCGRDKELEQLHSILSENNKIFITGIAGIGKSEFAKAYAKQYKSEYTNILYYQYNGSLQHLISDIEFTDDMPDESEEVKLKKHNRFLRALKEDSLIIIDNFNTTASDEQLLNVLLKYKCRVIFTTRSRFECGYSFELKEIENVNTLVDLFGKFYTETESCRDTIVDIIEAVYHHTFIAELAARHLQKGLIEPNELLEKLKGSSVNPHTTDKIKISKDGINFKDTYYNHLHTLFSLFLLNEQMQNIMRCMTFIPASGISSKLFAKLLALSDLNEINDLIELGYIDEIDTRTITLLPVIRDISIEELKPDYSNCSDFLTSLHNICIARGFDFPNLRLLFRTVENAINCISVDDINAHLLFMEDVFPYMEKHNYESGIKNIIEKMTAVLKDKNIGSANDRALLYSFRSAHERLFRSDNEKAIELIKKAISTCVPEDNKQLAMNLYMSLGVLYQENNKFDLAKENMEKAVSLVYEINEYTNDVIIAVRNYARLLARIGDTNNALLNLKNCTSKMNSIGINDTIDYADLLFEIGSISVQIKDIETANISFVKAFKIYSGKLNNTEFERLLCQVRECCKAAGMQDMPDCLAIT